MERPRWLYWLLHGLQTSATVAIAGVALWGAFLTDIPERLISELNSELAEVKAELRSIEAERDTAKSEALAAIAELEETVKQKRMVEAQVDAIARELQKARGDLQSERARLQTLTEINDSLQLKITELEKEILAKQAQIGQLSQQAEQYKGSARGEAWIGPSIDIQVTELSALRDRIKKAKMVSAVPGLRTKQEKLAKERGEAETQEERLKILDNYHQSLSENERDLSMQFWLREDDENVPKNPDNLDDLENKLWAELEASTSSGSTTLNILMDEYVFSADLKPLSAADQAALKKDIRKFMDQRAEVFSAELFIIVQRGNYEALARTIPVIERNLELADSAMDDLWSVVEKKP